MPSKFEYFIRCIFWALNRPLVHALIARPFGLKIAKGSDRVPKPPFVMVCNHANFLDPWMVGYKSPKGLFIMMNDDGFRAGAFTRWYLHSIGAFAKKKGAHDYKAMKFTLNLLRGGFPVLIFPEGQTSWDGETQPIYGGVEKIIKRGKCPMVMMNLSGNFLSRPWWAETSRKGRVSLKIKVVTPQEVSDTPDDKLLDIIKTYLYNNDVKHPENAKVAFKGKDFCLGLERFVWICPQCKVEDQLVTAGNKISCTACTATWEMNGNAVFTPGLPNIALIGDLHDWAHWHKEQVKEKITNAKPDDILTSSENVLLRTEDEDGTFVDRSRGKLTLTPVTIKYTPENGEELRWVRSEISDYVIQKKDALEFRADGKYYRYVFKNHSPMKWIFYLRYLDGYAEIEERGYY